MSKKYRKSARGFPAAPQSETRSARRRRNPLSDRGPLVVHVYMPQGDISPFVGIRPGWRYLVFKTLTVRAIILIDDDEFRSLQCLRQQQGEKGNQPTHLPPAVVGSDVQTTFYWVQCTPRYS